HYTGAAWYQRKIEVPAAWAGRRLTLFLERAHWTTTVWLDDQLAGSNDANSVAQVYALPANVAAGTHRLTIRVDNRLIPDIGENSHSISDHTQGNWNGIVGRIELTAHQPIWVENFDLFPDVQTRAVAVRGRLGRLGNQPWPRNVTLAGSTTGSASTVANVATDGTFTANYAFKADAGLWDEFSPNLHKLAVTLENGERREVTFGFRKIGRDGRQLTLNGRKLFLRGALDCAAFPRTGHPPTDVASWKRVLGVVKAHGLNHVRYHSWCPPEAAFVAADEIGIYLQVEVATWPNWSTLLGEGKPVDAWIDVETERIVRAYGNHASFVLFCAGNEPGGDRHAAWTSGWVERQRKADSRRIYTGGAGWPEIPENDLHSRSEPRIQHWTEGLASRINSRPPETRTDYTDFIRQRAIPVVSHEIGQWCVYPNFAEMPKYTGYLKPKNFEIFKESLEAKGLGARAHDFLIASGKLQALCYKEDIESALRTPEMGGFQLLGLQDFPGQGTALVGVVDAFWEDKGYISAEQFRRFCNSTVPLARLDKRVFTAAEHLIADIEVSHFGAAPLARQAVRWSLVNDAGTAVAKGEFAPREIGIGAAQAVGRVDLRLAELPQPARYRLVVELPGTAFANDWDVWVYPAAAQVAAESPAAVTIASKLDAATVAKLERGETVWLMAGKAYVKPDEKRPVALGFSSIFWNTAWTNGQAPHTLGVLCDPKHPALRRFPTDSHSNWQWWYPVTNGAAMILDSLPAEVQPIVQVIDDWFTNRKLALVFEARVGKGRLLVSSIELSGAALDPVRRQLRASLLDYAGSSAFQPRTTLTAAEINRVFNDRPAP
ncbi:MAG: sugar-binding domain-containing protein, partial [Opitutaceae bacterium]